MPDLDGTHNFVYENESINEGKLSPIKEDDAGGVSGASSDDDDVFINGRGAVLSGPNPNKKVLRCVEDLVANENSFSDGWDERILSFCKNKY